MSSSHYTSIILSGLPLSGKTTLAQRLSDIYKWEIYSIGQIWRERWKQKYPDEAISFEAYWRNVSVDDNRKVNEEARVTFQQGNVIGDTRYTNSCEGLPVLLVFVTADLETRARRGMQTDKYVGKSLAEIRQILLRRERDEFSMGQQLYGTRYDYRNPHHYHLMLNSRVLTVEQEVAIVTGLVAACTK